MSTKIFNGYQINKKLSAYSLLSLLEKISKDMQLICNELYHKEISELASICLDFELAFDKEEVKEIIKNRYGYVPNEYTYHSLSSYVEDIVEIHSKSTKRSRSAFDFKCEFILYPIKNKTLFRLFSQKNDYKTVLGEVDSDGKELPSSKYKYVNPYYYYNNTDIPEHLSKSDWDEREEDWEEACGDNNEGLVYSLTKIPYEYDRNIVLNNISESYDIRLKKLAVNKVDNDFEQKVKDEKYDTSKIIRLINDYQRSDDYKVAITEAIEYFKQIIPKSYTIEDLRKISLK